MLAVAVKTVGVEEVAAKPENCGVVVLDKSFIAVLKAANSDFRVPTPEMLLVVVVVARVI
ncbi:peptidyl-prolyl cis-trans isomerase [Pseudomonas sp. St290]|nr:peptidyl-prolyl cis-trans isomerase [Pseudomonas sp. St290]